MNEANIVTNYNKIDVSRGTGDLDYVLHELAHFVVLFRRAPRFTKDDPQDMELVLENMSCGLAQLHELRVIKLQHTVLGTPAKTILKSVWWGICDVADDPISGRNIVTSQTKAIRLMRGMCVSPRLVTTYRHAIEKFS